MTWELQGEEGEHYLEYQYGDRIFQKDVLITTEKGYRNPVQVVSNSDVKSINIDMQKLKVNLGFMNLSWFWTYVIFTLITSTLMRKILKVY